MWPLESPGAAELQEPALSLTDDTPPGASEEPAAAEAAETPNPGWCWPCRSSPCASRVQPAVHLEQEEVEASDQNGIFYYKGQAVEGYWKDCIIILWSQFAVSLVGKEAKKKAPCPGLGLFYTLLSAFLFSVGSLFVKKVQDVHAVEISAFRCMFQLLVIIPCLIYRKTGFIGPKGQRIFLFLRGALGSTAMILLYYAFQTTSLADATVISFSCPVFTSIFAWIFLKEKYSLWDALFTSFAITGVILIVRPPFLFGSNSVRMVENYSDHLKGTLASVGHALFAAFTLIILRKMGKSVEYFLSIWYYVVLGLMECVIVLFIIGEWRLPYCGLDRLFLILIGLFGLGGQVFLTKAIQIEKAGPVAIMKTMDVVFAFIFQIIFLNDVPTWWTVGGALCVVASSTGAAIRKWCQSSK